MPLKAPRSLFLEHLILQSFTPIMVLFKDFMVHVNGRCTLMVKEKTRPEQDVSFETWDIDMHRLTFTILFVWSCIFKIFAHIFIKHAYFVPF